MTIITMTDDKEKNIGLPHKTTKNQKIAVINSSSNPRPMFLAVIKDHLSPIEYFDSEE